jgi:hypothetical protein
MRMPMKVRAEESKSPSPTVPVSEARKFTATGSFPLLGKGNIYYPLCMHRGTVYDEPASDASSKDSYDSDEFSPLEPNIDELLSFVPLSRQVGRQLLFTRG